MGETTQGGVVDRICRFRYHEVLCHAQGRHLHGVPMNGAELDVDLNRVATGSYLLSLAVR